MEGGREEGWREGWRDRGMEGWRDGGMEGWRDGEIKGWMEGERGEKGEKIAGEGTGREELAHLQGCES